MLSHVVGWHALNHMPAPAGTYAAAQTGLEPGVSSGGKREFRESL